MIMKQIWHDICLGHFRELEKTSQTKIKSKKILDCFLKLYGNNFKITKCNGDAKILDHSKSFHHKFSKGFNMRECRFFRLLKQNRIIVHQNISIKTKEILEKLKDDSITYSEKKEILKKLLETDEYIHIWKFYSTNYLIQKL